MQHVPKPPPPSTPARDLAGQGSVVVAAPPDVVWPLLLDPATLAAVIPGAGFVERIGEDRFKAPMSFGVGFVRSRYLAELRVAGQDPPRTLDLAGHSSGAWGGGEAAARMTLVPLARGRTRIEWRYEGRVYGPVAVLGRGLHQAAADVFIRRVFGALVRQVEARQEPG